MRLFDDNARPLYLLKRIVETDQGFELRSDNPAVSPLPAGQDTVVVALHVATVQPDDFLSPNEAALVDAVSQELRTHQSFDAYADAFQATARALRDLLQARSELTDALHAGDAGRLRASLGNWLVESFGMEKEAAGVASRRVALTAFQRLQGQRT